VKLRRPPEFLVGDLIVGGFIAGLGGIALTGLSREQATSTLVVIGFLWWFGWPWYLRRRAHRLTILRSLVGASPDGFEEAVAELFEQRGYENVHRSPDHPGDVRCLDRAGRSVVVRAKRPSPGRRIGSQEMKRFVREVRAHHMADRGIFVTTSTFTPSAFAIARKGGIGRMEGRQLVHAMASTERGDHEFDRHLHESSGPGWDPPRVIRLAVLTGLTAMGLALWIGPTIQALRV
jgi:hypothetical protein